MKHTFYFEEGTWGAKGIYQTSGGEAIPVEGKARVSHTADKWLYENEMRVLNGSGEVFSGRYEIDPLNSGKEVYFFKAAVTTSGLVSGKTLVFHDSILNTYESDNKEYTSHELFLKIEDTIYLSRGALFKNSQISSCWAIQLTKTP